MVEVIPTIIAKTKEEFEAMVRKIEPYFEWAHLDIMDGGFTPSISIKGYEEIITIETKLKFGVHLMVAHPQEYLPKWFIDKVGRIFIHAEAQGNIKDMLLQIKAQDRRAGLVLNPETRVETILDYVPVLDYIQFMTVHPGQYGAPFLIDVIDKILNFHDTYPDIPIAVDGGMNPQTALLAIGAGAKIIFSGHYIMNSNDIPKAIRELSGSWVRKLASKKLAGSLTHQLKY